MSRHFSKSIYMVLWRDLWLEPFSVWLPVYRYVTCSDDVRFLWTEKQTHLAGCNIFCFLFLIALVFPFNLSQWAIESLRRFSTFWNCVTKSRLNYAVVILLSYHRFKTSKRSSRCLRILGSIIFFKHDPVFLGATTIPLLNLREALLPTGYVCVWGGWELGRGNIGRCVLWLSPSATIWPWAV